MRIAKLLCEYQENPIGLGALHPRFTWIIEGDVRGIKQTAYRVQVCKRDPSLGEWLWDSGQVESSESVHIPYNGPELQSCTRYHYTVKVWDNQGRSSSAQAFWDTGMFSPTDWSAEWMTCQLAANGLSNDAAHLLRKTF